MKRSLKEAITNLRKGDSTKDSSLMGYVLATVMDVVSERLELIKEEVSDELRGFIQEEVKKNIYKGDPGRDGYTPVKGIDYFDGKNGEDGGDGEDVDVNEVVRKVFSLIPTPKNGKDGEDGSPDTPQQIADKLNKLIEKIDISVIKGLELRLTNLGNSIRQSVTKGGQSGGMGNWIHESFSVGSTTTYVTLANNISANGYALMVFYNGQFLPRGIGYTQSGKKITLLFTPDDSTSVDVAYVRK